MILVALPTELTPSLPLLSREQLIKNIYTYIYHPLHIVCCSEARALRLGCWEHIILRITDLFEHLLEACFCAIWLNYIELRKLVNCPVC